MLRAFVVADVVSRAQVERERESLYPPNTVSDDFTETNLPEEPDEELNLASLESLFPKQYTSSAYEAGL